VTQPILKHRLNTLDATFYYYERKEAPFHVGSTMIFDGVELMNISFDHTPVCHRYTVTRTRSG
jgi:hypothetical protein